MIACSITPRVRNKEGKMVDSRLFKDILYFSGDRGLTVRTYQTVKGEEFVERMGGKLVRDENGEFTFASLMEHTDLVFRIPPERLMERMSDRQGFTVKGRDKEWADTARNLEDLMGNAIEFNNNSPFKDMFTAIVRRVSGKGRNGSSLVVRLERKTAENAALAAEMRKERTLNGRIREILARHGVAVGALTELERRMGINGVTDFSRAQKAADGLVELIRLAKGEKGEKALPEEFAHFIVEAMIDSPFVRRLLNQVSSEGAIREILGEEYDRYMEMYGGDMSRMSREAAGKLLAKHFLASESVPKEKPYRSILQKVIGAVKEFFGSFSINETRRALRDAEASAGIIAAGVLDGSMEKDIDLRKIKRLDRLYQAERTEVGRKARTLREIVKTLKERKETMTRGKRMIREELEDLQANLDNAEYDEGIYNFLENAVSEGYRLVRQVEEVLFDDEATLRDKARVIRSIRDYTKAYAGLLTSVRATLRDSEDKEAKKALRQMANLTAELKGYYEDYAWDIFAQFIRPFIGDGVMDRLRERKDRYMSDEELIREWLDEEQGDITIFDRWLDSAAESTDNFVKLIDAAVKKAKNNARLAAIKLQKRLEAAGIELEQAGYKDTGWMYARDADGRMTGDFIAKYDNERFNRDCLEAYDRYLEGKSEGDEGYEEAITAYNTWMEEHTDTDASGKRTPRMSLYVTHEYNGLSAAQRKFFDEVMDIKEELDNYLPPHYTELKNAPKIRKSVVERAKGMKGVKDGVDQIGVVIKETFVKNSSDEEIFGMRADKDSLGKRKAQVLPILYTSLGDMRVEDMSTDVVSTMTAYAQMAVDYKEMVGIVDALEVGRELSSRNRNRARANARMDDYFNMQVYGRYMEDEGTVLGKLSLTKLYNFFNKMTSINGLGLNLMAGVSNVLTGTVMMRIESFCKEYFTESDTLRADGIYASHLPDYLAEIGKRVKTSKLALWDELFNVLQDYGEGGGNFNIRTRVGQLANEGAIYFLNTCGEHWMQNRTALALALNTKVRDANGNLTDTNLWDAMEVAYIDPANRDKGAYLRLKEGYTFDDDARNAFTQRAKAINQRMHGIYNEIDRSAIQKLGVGRMGMIFRKWMRPSWNRRFKRTTYNFDIGSETEGYYRTLGRFMWRLKDELRQGQLDIATTYQSLNPNEKANLKRALTEVAHFLALGLLASFIEWPDDDDDKPWLVSFAEYQLKRTFNEVGAMVPTPLMLDQGFDILKTPMAGVNTAEKLVDMIGLLNPFNYGEDAVMRSGRYEGHTKAYKILMESPLIPMQGTIRRAMTPEESLKMFDW